MSINTAADEAAAEARAEAAKPVPVALFRDIKWGHLVVMRMHREDFTLPDYVRISDVIDVSFPPLTDDAVTAGAIRALDTRREQVVEKFTDELRQIDRQRSELLAITSVSA
jgi:hypothetical protein